ncbi:hypothetical protein LXH13_27860 [Streptomyces spinosirectus]|jgi:hypothetical protein|uniref:hypothetical protein n=1 Tax=Streptomyces TaxID=1883 RepID=UPI000D37CC4F|nr:MULTISPECIES: hypothetical protein [Streptomyces]MBY8343202.1 hypothetical protein [Streptomyces plumbidurans]PTM85967.1 hypothetical protein C7821_11945 [Streptomyces sp. VMFN-G11Ma]UIR20621.1 hypothetical protein LXH13_27860 [Streptomyces spinosirectus]
MGTSKTVDEAKNEAAEVKPEEDTVDATATEAPEASEKTAEDTAEETPEEATAQADLAESDDAEGVQPSGVGQGAGAVVSAALGIVSLTGSWVGTVASARQSLIGQLHAQSSQNSSVSKLLDEGYGNAWHATALWGGIFALLGLVIGVVVLARPAFGTPGRPQAVWIKSVAWGGVALGVIGLLLAVLKYTDVLLGLPSVS